MFTYELFAFYAEDDPEDADFEPDYGVTGGRTRNKVITFTAFEITTYNKKQSYHHYCF